jgi:hypothetical protein
MSAKKSVVKREENLPAETGFLFEDNGPTGLEGTTAETFKIPFYKVLNKLSPEVEDNLGQPGQLFNTGSKKASDQLEVVVLKIEHAIVNWEKSVSNTGKFLGRYDYLQGSKLVASAEGLKKFDAEGNPLVDTLEFYLMDVNNPSNIGVLAFSKTSFKHGQAWATAINMLTDGERPFKKSYAGIWTISTAKESNDYGTWDTVGNTPVCNGRFIDQQLFSQYIKPAIEMLKTAKTDYKITEDSVQEGGETPNI